MRCILYGFIIDYVKDIFIEDIFFYIFEKLKEVIEGKIYCIKGKKEKKIVEQSLKIRNVIEVKEVVFVFCGQGLIFGVGIMWVEVFCFL